VTFEGSKGVAFIGCVIDPLIVINNNSNSDPSWTRWENCFDSDGICSPLKQYNGGKAGAEFTITQIVADGASDALLVGVVASKTATNDSQTLYDFKASTTEIKSFGLGNGRLNLVGNLRVDYNSSVLDWTKCYVNIFRNGTNIQFVPCLLLKTATDTYPFFQISCQVDMAPGDLISIKLSNYTGFAVAMGGTGDTFVTFEGL